jgi:hypothetical protein
MALVFASLHRSTRAPAAGEGGVQAQSDPPSKLADGDELHLGRRLDPTSVNEGSVGRAAADHIPATDPPVHRGMSKLVQQTYPPDHGGKSPIPCSSHETSRHEPGAVRFRWPRSGGAQALGAPCNRSWLQSPVYGVAQRSASTGTDRQPPRHSVAGQPPFGTARPLSWRPP